MRRVRLWSFFTPFWPFCKSKLLPGILSGLIAGGALILWQRSLEYESARQTYRREVSVLRERIREAIAVPDVFTIDSARASTPPRAEEVMKIIRELPISLWREELFEEKPFLDSIYNFQRSYSQFMSSALEYDQALSQFARDFNSAHGLATINDGALRSYIFGTLHGIPSAKLAKWIDYGLNKIPERFEKARSLALQNERILKTRGPYVDSRKNLVDALSNVIAKLDA